MPTIFNVQADVVAGYQTSADIIRSILEVGLSDDVHPVVVKYLDHLGSWLGASPRSMEMIRSAVCHHGSVKLRKLGLLVGIKPVDTARLLADCSGGVAWLAWEAALLECYSHEDIAMFQQEAGRLIGLKSIVLPHMRELVSALGATAPRLGTASFPEHYAKICGAMRQTLFASTELCPAGVAEPPLMSDVQEVLVRVAEAYKEQKPIIIRGQQSIGWLAATLTWIYDEAVEILAAGTVVREAETRCNTDEFPPLIAVELCEEQSACLQVDYRMETKDLVATLTAAPRQDTLTSFGPRRSRADQYFSNWVNCTTPILSHELGRLSSAAAQVACGLLRTIHVTNEGGETGLRAETQGAGKQLVNVLRLPSSYSDVRRVREFFAVPETTAPVQIGAPTSQLQLILKEEADAQSVHTVMEGGSTTALAFLAKMPSLREAYGRMVREMIRVGIRGNNECSCMPPGTGPEAWLPSAHEPFCGIYQAASLAVELVAACLCSLFIEGPTSPRLTMFSAAPLRWSISKAIEQSVLTGSALISGADLMKSILVVAGYSGDYGYGPLIVCSGGQALALAALSDMALSPVSVGRVMAFPGAILHRDQYYNRLVVGRCHRSGGGSIRTVRNPLKKGLGSDGSLILYPSAEGAAHSTEVHIRETAQDLHLTVRTNQACGTIKEHDLWHCITAALTANILGDCKHDQDREYILRSAEVINIVGTGTSLGGGILESGVLTIAIVHRKGFNQLLNCGVSTNIVVQTSGCLHCAVSACKQVGVTYLVG